MAKVKLRDSIFEVTDQEDDALNGFAFTCPITDGTCGDRENGIPFTSLGWPTKELALKRLEGHVAEHRDPSATTPDLDSFRAEHGVGTKDGKAVITVEDIS